MFIKKFVKKNRFLYFITCFVGIQFFYLILYAYLLYEKISILNLLFIIIVMASYSILLYAFRMFLWHYIMYIALAMFYLWSLANFAHFKVFETFLKISISQVTTFYGGLFDLVFSFASYIPFKLYFISIFFFSLSIYYGVKFSKSERSQKIILNGFDLQKKRLSSKIYLICGYFGLLTILNLGGYILVEYLNKNPKASWWDLKAQIIDYGPVGHTYSQFIEKFKKNNSLSILPKQNNEEQNSIIEKNNQEIHFLEIESQDLTNLQKAKKLFDNGVESKKDFIINKIPVFAQNKKPNILIIQLESISSWAVDNIQTPMPFLKSLLKNQTTVDEFYANSCETINAEFAMNCSYVPGSTEPISFSNKYNDYYCFPSVLQDRYNYETYFFHANLPSFWDRDILIPKWGFKNTFFTPTYRQKEYDEKIFKDALNKLNQEKNPFYAYITTFTTHSPHNEELMKYYNDRHGEIIKPFDGELSEYTKDVEINEEGVRLYFGFLRATDNALKNMYKQFQSSGLAKNTILVIYNDHRFYNFNQNADNYFKLYNKSPFVMVFPQNINASLAPLASHIDIAPTLLNIIEGDKYNPPQNFLGTSLFLKDHKNQVINKCLGKSFYLNEDVLVNGNDILGMYKTTPLKENIDEDILVKYNMLAKYLIKYTDLALNKNELFIK